MALRLLFSMTLLAFLMFSCGPKEGTTLSGFKYQIISSEKGNTPKPGEMIYYHMTTMSNNQIIKTTRILERPQVFEMTDDQKLKELESPFLDVLKYMSAGDSAVVYQNIGSDTKLPAEYGDTDQIVYGVYLVKIVSQEEYQKDQERERIEQANEKQAYREKEQKAAAVMNSLFQQPKDTRLSEFKTTENGLKYKILNEGDFEINAEDGKHVIDLSYYGCLSDGQRFDSSYQYGMPYKFVKGTANIMPGWNEAAGILNKGAEAIIFVPSELAFGEREFKGNVNIPANEDLYFHFIIEDITEKK